MDNIESNSTLKHLDANNLLCYWYGVTRSKFKKYNLIEQAEEISIR